MELDPAETALIVVDMQNSFCHPDGELYSEASEKVIRPINEMISRARDSRVRIYFTKDYHFKDQFKFNDNYNEFDRWGEHAVAGQWGSEIHTAINDRISDHIVEKQTYDAFENTDLGVYLAKHQIENVVIVGTLANVCVLHTASSAALNDFRPIVVDDCVGYIEEPQKEYALEHIDFLFGEVEDSDSIEFEEDL